MKKIVFGVGWVAYIAMWCADWHEAALLTCVGALGVVGITLREIAIEQRRREAKKDVRRRLRAQTVCGPVRHAPEFARVGEPGPERIHLAVGKATGLRIGVIMFGSSAYTGRLESSDVSVRRRANYRWN